MDVRARGQVLVPVVGGMTAMMTATGAVALAHVAHAAPDATDAAGGTAAPAGALQGCEAYFGFGKDVSVTNLVEFDVYDENGDDGVDHAVPDDTSVVLVLHFEGGDVECTPFEVTEEQWADGIDPSWDIPFPGPGHFAYPSAQLGFSDGDLGDLTDVGFRVTDDPGGEHTLESPTGEVMLPDFQLDPDETFEPVVIDPRVLDLLTEEVSADAAAAYADAGETCDFAGDELPEEDATDEDLLDGLNFLVEYLGYDFVITEADCLDMGISNAESSSKLGVIEATAHVQDIVLSLPVVPEEPVEPTTPPGAPTPVVDDVDYTG